MNKSSFCKKLLLYVAPLMMICIYPTDSIYLDRIISKNVSFKKKKKFLEVYCFIYPFIACFDHKGNGRGLDWNSVIALLNYYVENDLVATNSCMVNIFGGVSICQTL